MSDVPKISHCYTNPFPPSIYAHRALNTEITFYLIYWEQSGSDPVCGGHDKSPLISVWYGDKNIASSFGGGRSFKKLPVYVSSLTFLQFWRNKLKNLGQDEFLCEQLYGDLDLKHQTYGESCFGTSAQNCSFGQSCTLNIKGPIAARMLEIRCCVDLAGVSK